SRAGSPNSARSRHATMLSAIGPAASRRPASWRRVVASRSPRSLPPCSSGTRIPSPPVSARRRPSSASKPGLSARRTRPVLHPLANSSAKVSRSSSCSGVRARFMRFLSLSRYGGSERCSAQAPAFPDGLLDQSDDPRDRPDCLVVIEPPVDHQTFVRRDAPEHVENRRRGDAVRRWPPRGARLHRAEQRLPLALAGLGERRIERPAWLSRGRGNVLEDPRRDADAVLEPQRCQVDACLLLEPVHHRIPKRLLVHEVAGARPPAPPGPPAPRAGARPPPSARGRAA